MTNKSMVILLAIIALLSIAVIVANGKTGIAEAKAVALEKKLLTIQSIITGEIDD